MREEGALGAPERGLEGLIDEALDSKEPIKKPQTEQIRPQSLLEKVILSEWTAPVFAAAIGAINYTTPQSPPASITENLAASAIIAGFSYATARLIRQDWLIRKAETVQRRFRSLPSKFLGFFAEHPERIAGSIAAYTTLKLVSPMFTSVALPDIFRHPESITIAADLSAFISSTIFVISYPATSLAFGRVFHPETFKTIYQASAAAINAVREKYGKTTDNLEQLLQMQRSYGKSVILQALAGDFQSFGNDEKFVDTDYNVFLTDKIHHAGRSDWALDPFIYVLKKIVLNKAKNLPPQTGKPALPYLIAGTEAFAVGNLAAADTFLADAVKQDRHELIPHAFRAAFLRRTGRNRSADLQMRVCAELVMQHDVEFEPVEGSRNEVFLAGNVALKRNTDPQNLVKEGEVIGKFREKNGSAVIYPLPVYRLGDYYYLTSEKAISETLLDLIKQRRATLEDFAQAVGLMVQLQRSGMELYNAGELELDDRILEIDVSKPETLYFAQRRLRAVEQIERFNEVRLPESYKSALGHGLSFVDRTLASSRLLTLYKDFNPKNVLKRPFGPTQALDFEPGSLRLLPPQVDLVNLLEFVEYLQPRHKALLTELFVSQFERENRVRVDREEFHAVYEFAAFQWHYERLIYRPEEAAKALTEERREEKKKEQVRHLLSAREHLETIVAKGYASGEDLNAALKAKDELSLPIFPDAAEYDRLCSIVEREREGLLSNEPLPVSNTRLAVASAAAFAILALAIAGGVIVKNNYVPILKVPVFPQHDRVLLAVSGEREIRRPHRGIQEHSVLGIDYYVIDAERDTLHFLTEADDLISTHLSMFKDKAVFVRDTHIVLYDFRSREFKVIEDDRFENPAISPNGLWIASNLRKAYLAENMSELWLIRPYDVKTKQITGFPNAFVSPWSGWSPDGTYLLFFSNNELVNDNHYPDPLKVWINTYNLSKDEIKTGPPVAVRQGYLAAWSPTGLLAYTVDDRKKVYIADPQFNGGREVYRAGNRDLLGYDTESIDDIVFAGPDHLLIFSTLFNQKSEGVMFNLSLLNLRNSQLTLLNGTFLSDISEDGTKLIYACGDISDICELNIGTGQTRNLTNTPNLREAGAVYSPNGNKVYFVAVPALDCTEGGCAPSLRVIDLKTGKSKLLKESQDGKVGYALIAQ